jgi:hypothetical protein
MHIILLAATTSSQAGFPRHGIVPGKDAALFHLEFAANCRPKMF